MSRSTSHITESHLILQNGGKKKKIVLDIVHLKTREQHVLPVLGPVYVKGMGLKEP